MSIQRTTTLQAPAVSADLPVAAMSEFFRRHGAGILIALLLAGTLVFPRWWVIASDPDEGARVPISPYGAAAIGYDETLYTSSIRNAFDGTLPVSDPYLANHDGGTPQRSAIPHEAIGVLGRLTGDPFSALALVTTAAAIAALLLLYALLYQITGSRWAAIALIPVVLVVIHVLNVAEGILPLRHREILAPILKVDPRRELHAWTRFPAPILVLAPFFAAVYALPKAVETGARRWMAVAAIALAFLVYTYVYYWTAATLALAGWFAVLLLTRQGLQARRLLIVGGAAMLIALPEFIILANSAVSLPADARSRVGLDEFGIDTSLAVTLAQRLVVGLPFLFVLARRPSRSVLYVALFLSPLFLGAFTGVVPQPWHYSTQVWAVFAIPAVVAGSAALFASTPLDRIARPAAFALAVAAAVCFAYIIALQARAIAGTDDAFAVTADEDHALSWIRANVSSDDTVVSPSITTNLLLASLTSSSQYLAEGGFTVADDDELVERILRAQAAFGYSEDDVFARLNVNNEFDGFPVNDARGSSNEQERELEDYLAFFTFSFEITDQTAFTERADTWRPRYRELLRQTDVLSAYPAQYLYCGPRERFFDVAAPSPGTYVRVALASGDVIVYERVPESTPGAVPFGGCH